MSENSKQLELQLFADSAIAGENAPDAGETRLRDLGVPEGVIEKRAKRARGHTSCAPIQQVAAADTAPVNSASEPSPHAASADKESAQSAPDAENEPSETRLTWEEIMRDPEYNAKMQSVIKGRLRKSADAEKALSELQPLLGILSEKYGVDGSDTEALAAALSDNSDTDSLRPSADFDAHIKNLHAQGEALKKSFPDFELLKELRDPTFRRMTAPDVGISVEDAYYARHRDELQAKTMQVIAQLTAEKLLNSIRAGQSRPIENGRSGRAASVTSFDYAHASPEQRAALKKQIRDAAARGQKLYPDLL